MIVLQILNSPTSGAAIAPAISGGLESTMARSEALSASRFDALSRQTDRELLSQRMCDLRLGIPERVLRQVESIERRLSRRGLNLRYQVWLSDEFFSPDGVPGFAIPFYLAHPRLTALERRMMHGAEGSNSSQCLRILRHEAGHAFLNAFDLRRHPRLRKAFGDFNAPYPRFYIPKPYSRQYVRNLAPGYAQAHPEEDFAETFAVWLLPRRTWRRLYPDGPARQKLETIDRMVGELQGERPVVGPSTAVGDLSRLKIRLEDHYDRKRAHYGIDRGTGYDRRIKRVFAAPAAQRATVTAESFLRKIEERLISDLARETGRPRYEFRAAVETLRRRTRELRLTAPARSTALSPQAIRILRRLLSGEPFRIAV